MNLETFNIKVRVQADQAKKSINEVKKDLNSTTKELYKLRDAWKVYNEAYETGDKAQIKALEKQFTKKFGSKWTDLATGKKTYEELNKEIEQNEKQQKKANSSTSKFVKHLKTIAASVLIWRALSQAIRNVVKGIKEGVENFYNFQKASGGGAFSKAMDNIASKMTAVKNALGAIIANFITKAEPFITELLDKFVALLNKVSAVIAKLFGDNYYWEASADIMTSWKQNNEETRQLISGIDKLNNIGASTNSAIVSENGEEYFRKVALTADNDPLKELKDFWDGTIKPFFTGVWGELKRFFRQLWSDVMQPAIQSMLDAIAGKIHDWWYGSEDSRNPITDTFSEIKENSDNFWDAIFHPFTTIKGWFTPNASGGVYTKPTLGLVGEYANAKSDPEIISPRSMMYDTVRQANGDIVSALVQCNQQLISALNNKSFKVVIGDETIGASANRANNDNYKLGGVGYA